MSSRPPRKSPARATRSFAGRTDRCSGTCSTARVSSAASRARARKSPGARALVVGSGGVGCAIAASLAAAGLSGIGLFDAAPASAEALARRLREHYPALAVTTGSNDPQGFDIVVNATPIGMHDYDPLPVDIDRIAPTTFVGEVVMREEFTPLLRRAKEKGCPIQVGTDMLFSRYRRISSSSAMERARPKSRAGSRNFSTHDAKESFP